MGLPYFYTLILGLHFMFSQVAMCCVSRVSCRTASKVDSETTELWANLRIHTDVTVYARESPMFYGVMMFICEHL